MPNNATDTHKNHVKQEDEIAPENEDTYSKPRSGDILIFVDSYDIKFYCFDGKTGHKMWTYTTESYINGAPGVWQNQVVGVHDNLV